MTENLPALCSIAQQIGSTCEHLIRLATGSMQTGTDNLRNLYQDMLLDEVEHIQVLTVELSKLVTVYTGDVNELYIAEKESDSNGNDTE